MVSRLRNPFPCSAAVVALVGMLMTCACSKQAPESPTTRAAESKSPDRDEKPTPSDPKPTPTTAQPKPATPAEVKPAVGSEEESTTEPKPSAASPPAKPAAPANPAPAAVTVPAPKTVEEAEQLILDRWGKLKSCRAQVLSLIEASNENGTRRITGNGSYELLRQGDGALARMDLDTDEALTIGKSTNTRSDRTHRTTDGYTLDSHVEFPMGGIATRIFLEPGHVFIIGGPYLVRSIHAIGDVKVVAPDAFTGSDNFVLEARPKDGGVPTRFYISLTHGLLNKMETADNDNRQSTQLLFENFRMDVEISPDRFRLTPPPDVTMDDYTLPPYAIGKPTEEELKAAVEFWATEQAKPKDEAAAAPK